MSDIIQPFKPFDLRIRGGLRRFDRPAVMAIINATPDSFFAGSRKQTAAEIAARTGQAIAEGADIIDLGACSSRPGAADVSENEELARLTMAMEAIRSVDADVPVSVDTFRASVASVAVGELGADIVNDISGGDLDDSMFDTVARLNVPYILMHMRGTPATMQQFTDYDNCGGVVAAVIGDLSRKIVELQLRGVADIIVDPGFGFSKTVEQNWQLLNALPEIARLLERPTLVGFSRKSMLTKPLGIATADALNATTVANTLAVAGGASIIRVHDVAAARQIVDLTSIISYNQPNRNS